LAYIRKARLAARAAALLRPGSTIIVDGGTTHAALVESLPSDLALTVVTHSPTIATLLEPFARIEVILVGGRLMRHSMVAVGTEAAEAYARVRADLCLLGVTGVHAEAGLTTGDHEEAAIKRRMIAQAAETAVIATPDKLGAVSPFAIAPLASVTTLVCRRRLRPRPWLVVGRGRPGIGRADARLCCMDQRSRRNGPDPAFFTGCGRISGVPAPACD
jgi:DeoR/GlpR family transcriptional regulator of sugar metabolism